MILGQKYLKNTQVHLLVEISTGIKPTQLFLKFEFP